MLNYMITSQIQIFTADYKSFSGDGDGDEM